MDCRELAGLLEELLDGQPAEDRRHAAGQHLRGCGPCRKLWKMARHDVRPAPLGDPAALAAAILAQTSGATCTSARSRLCAFVDQQLEPADLELMQHHVGRCASCSELSGVLSRLSVDLPLLAERQPDERFAVDVLARTLPARSRAALWVDRLSESCQRLLERPRAALEGAYLGTFVLALLFGAPGSPLVRLPRRALDLAAVNPVARLEQPVARLEANVSHGASASWQFARETLIDPSRRIAAEVVRLSASAREDLRGGIGTLLARPASEQESNKNDNPAKDAAPDLGDGS